MGETAITNLSERILSVYQEAEEEFKQHIPPWPEAVLMDKLKAICYYSAIYSPMVLLLCIVYGTYVLYVHSFVLPLIAQSSDQPQLYYFHSEEEAQWALQRGSGCLAAMTFFLLMFSLSFLRAVITSPGNIPQSSLWRVPSEGGSEDGEVKKADEALEDRLIERRKDGSCRTCTYCHLRKPDRTHHCKQCEACILVMDHHCNWIANCVGYFNFKYFLLVLWYGMLMAQLFTGTFWECLVVSLNDPDVDPVLVIVYSVVYTFTGLITFTLTAFFSFHIWLICKNYTTLEFCEKRRMKEPKYLQSPFDHGVYANFKHSMGNNVWAWPFPFWYDRPQDGGLYFT